MSECVVRMEMPDWCPCVLAEDNNGWYGPCFAYNGIPERAKEFDQCVEKMERPSWCPIICSLPEGHGRLIDWDALEKKGIKLARKVGEYRTEIGIPSDELFIVPAERSET